MFTKGDWEREVQYVHQRRKMKKKKPLVLPDKGDDYDPYLNQDPNYIRNCFIKARYSTARILGSTYTETIEHLMHYYSLSKQTIEVIITGNYPIKKQFRK